jgi:hypothetical protein
VLFPSVWESSGHGTIENARHRFAASPSSVCRDVVTMKLCGRQYSSPSQQISAFLALSTDCKKCQCQKIKIPNTLYTFSPSKFLPKLTTHIIFAHLFYVLLVTATGRCSYWLTFINVCPWFFSVYPGKYLNNAN